eukprot:Polyplicarium_translucidae@DN723_c0_g1_i2.p1
MPHAVHYEREPSRTVPPLVAPAAEAVKEIVDRERSSTGRPSAPGPLADGVPRKPNAIVGYTLCFIVAAHLIALVVLDVLHEGPALGPLGRGIVGCMAVMTTTTGTAGIVGIVGLNEALLRPTLGVYLGNSLLLVVLAATLCLEAPFLTNSGGTLDLWMTYGPMPLAVASLAYFSTVSDFHGHLDRAQLWASEKNGNVHAL